MPETRIEETDEKSVPEITTWVPIGPLEGVISSRASGVGDALDEGDGLDFPQEEELTIPAAPSTKHNASRTGVRFIPREAFEARFSSSFQLTAQHSASWRFLWG